MPWGRGEPHPSTKSAWWDIIRGSAKNAWYLQINSCYINQIGVNLHIPVFYFSWDIKFNLKSVPEQCAPRWHTWLMAMGEMIIEVSRACIIHLLRWGVGFCGEEGGSAVLPKWLDCYPSPPLTTVGGHWKVSPRIWWIQYPLSKLSIPFVKLNLAFKVGGDNKSLRRLLLSNHFSFQEACNSTPTPTLFFTIYKG